MSATIWLFPIQKVVTPKTEILFVGQAIQRTHDTSTTYKRREKGHHNTETQKSGYGKAIYIHR